MNKYIEKIYDEGEKLYIYLSKDIENAPEKAFTNIFDPTEENANINRIKTNYLNLLYKEVYIYLPQGLTVIKEKLFCYSFKDLYDYYKGTKDCRYTKIKTNVILPEGLKIIEKKAFHLTDIIFNIPESVEYIGELAFCSFRFLENDKIIVPKNTTYIGDGAITGWNGEIIIKNNDRYFSDGYAIYDKKEKKLVSYFADNCVSKSTYEIWEETETISRYAFYCPDFLDVLVLSPNLKYFSYDIYPYPYSVIPPKKIILKSFDTKIDYNSFCENPHTKIQFPDGSIISPYDRINTDGINVLQENDDINGDINADIINEQKSLPIEAFIDPALDIDKISKMVEEHKNNFNLSDTKNPFDFDENEIFDGIDYDYNTFDDDNTQE